MPSPQWRTPQQARMNRPEPGAVDLRAFPRPGMALPGGEPVGLPDGAQFTVPLRALPIMGDVTALAVLVGTADQIALPRAPGARIFLAVLNTDAANTVYLNWSVPASATANSGSWPFAPGASYNFMDFVPQNDIHVVASAANTGLLLWYCNANVSPIP